MLRVNEGSTIKTVEWRTPFANLHSLFCGPIAHSDDEGLTLHVSGHATSNEGGAIRIVIQRSWSVCWDRVIAFKSASESFYRADTFECPAGARSFLIVASLWVKQFAPWLLDAHPECTHFVINADNWIVEVIALSTPTIHEIAE